MNNSLPWVEKYRPVHLSDVDGNEHIKRSLNNYGGIPSIPHLLFYGPPGTGKTSTILAIARENYGSNLKSMVLELNASDHRDIETVRGIIDTFCNNSSLSLFNCHQDVKLVILDEADAMTIDAQSALRRIIEKSTKNVRFCICCNYINKILPALRSRCTKFKFKPLDNNSLKITAKRIIENESIQINQDGIDAILNLSNGDARKVINILQSISLASKNKITSESIYQCVGVPTPEEIKHILNLMVSYEFKIAFSKLSVIIHEKGYSLADIVKYTTDIIMQDTSIFTEDRLGIILDEFSNVEYNLSVGGCEKLQLGLLVGSFHINY